MERPTHSELGEVIDNAFFDEELMIEAGAFARGLGIEPTTEEGDAFANYTHLCVSLGATYLFTHLFGEDALDDLIGEMIDLGIRDILEAGK